MASTKAGRDESANGTDLAQAVAPGVKQAVNTAVREIARSIFGTRKRG